MHSITDKVPFPSSSASSKIWRATISNPFLVKSWARFDNLHRNYAWLYLIIMSPSQFFVHVFFVQKSKELFKRHISINIGVHPTK